MKTKQKLPKWSSAQLSIAGVIVALVKFALTPARRRAAGWPWRRGWTRGSSRIPGCAPAPGSASRRTTASSTCWRTDRKIVSCFLLICPISRYRFCWWKRNDWCVRPLMQRFHGCVKVYSSAYSCIIYRNSKIHLDWIRENAETTRSIHSQARKCSR